MFKQVHLAERLSTQIAHAHDVHELLRLCMLDC